MIREQASWQNEIDARISTLNPRFQDHVRANVDAVKKASLGFGPDATSPDPASGLRCVINLASVHVPAFCNHGYQNGYDLKKYRLGGSPGAGLKTRELVDSTLPVKAPENIYFGAAALSGAGVRFYGDICLVLKSDQLDAGTIVLDRNSYDLVRPPLSGTLRGNPAKMRSKAESLAGLWNYAGTIAALKVVFGFTERDRRLTTGQMASAILDDEDYIEVLKDGPFESKDLDAARISSPEAAMCSHIENKLVAGPAASLAEILYLTQRRSALTALSAEGVRVDVVTTDGRVR